MSLYSHIRVTTRRVKTSLTRQILAHRIQARHPTLNSDPTAIWDYGYNDIDALEIGKNVTVLAFVEIAVQKKNRFTPYEGRLVLGDGVTLAVGANIRAAGGTISIGPRSGIGQFSVLVAANHAVKAGVDYFNTRYDESRSGVSIGTNVWVGAHCVLLPGISIGDNALIAAGSVVNKNVPANEIWAGVPARFIRAIS